MPVFRACFRNDDETIESLNIMVHVNIEVFGRVQSIGFRYSAMEAASQMNITGFVKNMTDGSVYIEAEGEEKNIESFISWCHHGPPWARVDNIIVNKTTMQGFKSFEIKR